jgi:CrcB protein
MTLLTFVALSLAGGLGAALRLLSDGLLRARVSTSFPVGTAAINLTGSLLLGLITGLTLTRLLPEELHLILGGGLIGGFTTFSTASFETVRLAQDRRYVAALFNVFGALVASVAVSGFGLWVGLQI